MTAKPPATGLEHHYNTTELRQETWNKLKVTAATYYDRGQKDQKSADIVDAIHECFHVLDPIERYWAFPGKNTVDKLVEIFKRQDRYLFMQAVSYVVRSITSGSYRRELAPLQLPVGKEVTFQLNYSALVRSMTSPFVVKVVNSAAKS